MDSTSLSVSAQAAPVYLTPASGSSVSYGQAAVPVSGTFAPANSGTGTSQSAITPSVPSASAPSTAQETSQLKKSAEQLNQTAQPHFGSLQFNVDSGSGKMVLQVIDKETNNVLLQIPSKEALILSETIGQGHSGNLIKESA